MRRSLEGDWSIVLPDSWHQDRAEHHATFWRAPGRTMRVTGYTVRCADVLDMIAWLDTELPPDPTGKVGEVGSLGVEARAAWLYRQTGELHYTLYGYSFRGGEYLETVFFSADTADLAWAFDAWRSVDHTSSL